MTNPLIWKERIDAADNGVTYYGYAPRGAATDAEEWLISRVTRTGDDVVEEWASKEPNQVWDNRAGLTYG